jgi:diaminopimelate decarboxylase
MEGSLPSIFFEIYTNEIMEIVNNRYTIQGLDLLDVVKEFDHPVYVYDADKIGQQIDNMKAAFPGVKLKIKYACK